MAHTTGVVPWLLAWVMLSHLPFNIMAAESELQREKEMTCYHNARAEDVSGRNHVDTRASLVHGGLGAVRNDAAAYSLVP